MVRQFGALLGVLCLLGGEAWAASPVINNIVPRGGQRGTEVVVTITGQNIEDTQELVTYYPGITVAKIEPAKGNRIAATLRIAPDCRLGEHAIRVRTASGISTLDTFWVGALPTVEEKEPNTEFDKAQPIPMNVTVQGVVQSEDVDYFQVECKKGDRLSVEVEGMRLATTFFDPYVAILDAKRFELAAGDDAPTTAQDGGCSVVVPEDGKYYVLVRECSYGGNGASHYRLHIGNFPRPTAVIPAGGKPGETVEFRFLGDPKGEFTQKVTLPPANTPLYRLHAETKDGIHPAGFPIRIVDLPNTIGSGKNLNGATATAGPAPGAFNGVLANAGEIGCFKFTAKKGQALYVHCLARDVGSALDSVLEIQNDKGQRLAINDDANGSQDSALQFNPPADGDYYIVVRDHLNKGGIDYFYRVEAAPVQPETVLSVIRANPNNPRDQDRQSFAIPKGGRFGQVILVNRRNFGGALKLEFPTLPPGVTASFDGELDAGQSQIPVVFEAKADAALGGILMPILAKPTDPKQAAIPSRIGLDVGLVSGNPGQTVYHSQIVDRIATVVAEPAPFSIEVIEPKAPIPQNASMLLRVVAKRAEGFKGVITLRPLWVPPGVGIAATATIAEGQTETTISMNAAGNAAPRKWKTAIQAMANPGKGNVWVSSQLFTVEVAPALLTLKMQRSATDQGKPTEMLCKIEYNSDFDGKATVKLIGLPVKATAPDLEIAKGTNELVIPVTTDKTTPAGKHRVFCQVIARINGEVLTQNTGGSELRVDVPLPPKPVAKTPPPPVKAATPAPPKKEEPKRLTRLEQLRLDQEAREKAEKEAAGSK